MSTLTEIRKAIDPQAVTDARKIFKLFIKICEENPDAVIAAMSHFEQTRGKLLVHAHRNKAEYLYEIFNYD